METYHGTVKGNMIVLPEGVHLEEGAMVEVRILQVDDQALMQSAEEAFKQRLLEKGLLKRIKTPSRVQPQGDHTPISIEGTLSRAIIEDRR